MAELIHVCPACGDPLDIPMTPMQALDVAKAEIARLREKIAALKGNVSPEQAALGALPPALVDALRGATPEQMQEITDAVVCLRAGRELYVWFGSGSWWAQSKGTRSFPGDTLAEALHALAEKVKGAKP